MGKYTYVRHTRLGGLGHDVADVVGGRGAKDVAEALGTLQTLGIEAVGSIRGLLAVADQVHGGALGGSRDQQEGEKSKELHGE